MKDMADKDDIFNAAQQATQSVIDNLHLDPVTWFDFIFRILNIVTLGIFNKTRRE